MINRQSWRFSKTDLLTGKAVEGADFAAVSSGEGRRDSGVPVDVWRRCIFSRGTASWPHISSERERSSEGIWLCHGYHVYAESVRCAGDSLYGGSSDSDCHIQKKDITNQEELPGAHLQVLDRNGIVQEEWISERTPHKIQGKLTAGETYILRETIPADGYALAKDITFTVNKDGSVNYVEMRDDTTKVRIYKKRISGIGQRNTEGVVF